MKNWWSKLNRNQKILMSFVGLLFLIGIFYGALTEETKLDPTAVHKYDHGTFLVDERFEDLTSKYQELCGKPHNDQLKKEYQDLQQELMSLHQFGNECPELSYEDQSKLVRYARQKIESNKSLDHLMTSGTIDCW
jgi:hypothetical protein